MHENAPTADYFQGLTEPTVMRPLSKAGVVIGGVIGVDSIDRITQGLQEGNHLKTFLGSLEALVGIALAAAGGTVLVMMRKPEANQGTLPAANQPELPRETSLYDLPKAGS